MPTNSQPNPNRVMRGKSWQDLGGFHRAASILGYYSRHKNNDTGFRCVRDDILAPIPSKLKPIAQGIWFSFDDVLTSRVGQDTPLQFWRARGFRGVLSA